MSKTGTGRNGRFIEPQDLFDEVKAFQDQLKENPENARPSEKLGRLCIQLTENVLSSGCWNRYPPAQKQDMQSEALYRCMRACRLAKLELGPKKIFSYFTRTVWLAYLNVVVRNYKQVERKNKWIHDELARQGVSEAKIEELLGRKDGQHYSENRHAGAWYNCYKTEAQRKREESSIRDIKNVI